MALIDQYNTAVDATFQQRVKMAMLMLAYTILDTEDPRTVTNGSARRAWAQRITDTPDAYAAALAFAMVAQTPALTPASTDAQLRTALQNAIASRATAI